ncbi:MAG: hypothetical protein ACLTSZ_14950 [Lachnospiraceae bacterium]
MTCRQMDIRILPPDINTGEAGFSVEEGNIRYGLSAIKSVGRSCHRGASLERDGKTGPFTASMKDFMERMTGKDLNKRVIENFIKAGALDGLGGTRKSVHDDLRSTHGSGRPGAEKQPMTGQMTLFDLMGEEEKERV